MEKKKYKYELHCHTSDVSLCAFSTAKEAVEFYKNRGYDGIVITDHYSPQTFLFHKSLFPDLLFNNPFRPSGDTEVCQG